MFSMATNYSDVLLYNSKPTWAKLKYIKMKPSAYTYKNLKDLIKKYQNIFFFYLGQELVPPAHLKAQLSNFSEDLN